MRATRSYRAPRSTLDIDRFMHPGDEDAGAQKNWCDWNNLTRGKLNVIEIALQPGAGTGVLAEQLRRQSYRRLEADKAARFIERHRLAIDQA